MTELAHWSQLAGDLGLQIAMVSERSMVGWSFASVRRELAEPAMPEPKTTPWLHGERGGISVIAMPPAPYTLAMAEIDPPLFGIFWRAEGLELGDEDWDRVFRVEAFDAVRARETLRDAMARDGLVAVVDALTPPLPTAGPFR